MIRDSGFPRSNKNRLSLILKYHNFQTASSDDFRFTSDLLFWFCFIILWTFWLIVCAQSWCFWGSFPCLSRSSRRRSPPFACQSDSTRSCSRASTDLLWNRKLLLLQKKALTGDSSLPAELRHVLRYWPCPNHPPICLLVIQALRTQCFHGWYNGYIVL